MFHWIPSFQQTQSFHSNQKLSIRTGLSQTLPSLGPETCTEMVTNPVSSVYRNSYIPFLLKSIRFGIDFSNFSRFISGYSHTKLKIAMLIYMLLHHKFVFFSDMLLINYCNYASFNISICLVFFTFYLLQMNVVFSNFILSAKYPRRPQGLSMQLPWHGPSLEELPDVE